MSPVRLAVLVVLALAATAASAQASSVAITVPATPQNYWGDIHLTVSGTADQDAHVSVAYTPNANATCPASNAETGYISSTEGLGFDVPGGSFSRDVYLPGPAVGTHTDNPEGTTSAQEAWNGRKPGQHTLCAYLETRRTDPSAQPSTLAASPATAITYGPDCLGFRDMPAIAITRTKGRFGTFTVSGQAFWPLTITLDDYPNDPVTVNTGAGPWSAAWSMDADSRKQLAQGLQAVAASVGVTSRQASCQAADGSSAPAPYNQLTEYGNEMLLIGRDGSPLNDGEALPAPTFEEVAKLGLLQTATLAFPKGWTRGGTFTSTVRIDPPGKAKPFVLGTGKQSSGLMTVKVGALAKVKVAKLARKAKRARLLVETTFEPAIGGSAGGYTHHSKLTIVHD